MSKLHATSEDIANFIEDIINNKTDLFRLISWNILSDETQKELIKIKKTNAYEEYLSKMTDSILITVNEEIFDRMRPESGNPDYRELVIEDALVNVQTIENDNTGTMKIVIGKPAICITGDGYSKYGEDLVHAAETASMTFAQIQEEKKRAKEEEKERKAAEREARRAAKAEANKPKYDPNQGW